VEQQLAAGLAEWQITLDLLRSSRVDDDQIVAQQFLGQTPAPEPAPVQPATP
jgi:hypothetical protein